VTTPTRREFENARATIAEARRIEAELTVIERDREVAVCEAEAARAELGGLEGRRRLGDEAAAPRLGAAKERVSERLEHADLLDAARADLGARLSGLDLESVAAALRRGVAEYVADRVDALRAEAARVAPVLSRIRSQLLALERLPGAPHPGDIDSPFAPAYAVIAGRSLLLESSEPDPGEAARAERTLGPVVEEARALGVLIARAERARVRRRAEEFAREEAVHAGDLRPFVSDRAPDRER